MLMFAGRKVHVGLECKCTASGRNKPLPKCTYRKQSRPALENNAASVCFSRARKSRKLTILRAVVRWLGSLIGVAWVSGRGYDYRF